MKIGVVRLVVLVSAFILSGTPTALMQIGAWSIMLGQRDGRDGVLAFAKVTFLGQESCGRCRVISDGSDQSRRDVLSLREQAGLRLVKLSNQLVKIPGRCQLRPLLIFSMESSYSEARAEKPPIPPPRAGSFS